VLSEQRYIFTGVCLFHPFTDTSFDECTLHVHEITLVVQACRRFVVTVPPTSFETTYSLSKITLHLPETLTLHAWSARHSKLRHISSLVSVFQELYDSRSWTFRFFQCFIVSARPFNARHHSNVDDRQKYTINDLSSRSTHLTQLDVFCLYSQREINTEKLQV
jgi:hypothetical protein